MFESGRGSTEAQSLFCLQLPNQALSFAAKTPHAVFNLGSPDGKLCVNVSVHDYTSITPTEAACYVLSVGAGETDAERRGALKLLKEKRGKAFATQVDTSIARTRSGHDKRINTRVIKAAQNSLRASKAAEARWKTK